MGGGGDGGRGDQKEKKEMTRQMKKGDGHRHGPLFVVGRDPTSAVHLYFRIDREGAWGRVFPPWILDFLNLACWQVDATRRL